MAGGRVMVISRFNVDWRPDVGDLDFVIEVAHVRSEQRARELSDVLREALRVFVEGDTNGEAGDGRNTVEGLEA